MSILDGALHTVRSRGLRYGDPVEQYEKVARAWSVVLGREVEADDVVLCMIALKLVRASRVLAWDDVVDIAGYAEVLGRMNVELSPDVQRVLGEQDDLRSAG